MALPAVLVGIGLGLSFLGGRKRAKAARRSAELQADIARQQIDLRRDEIAVQREMALLGVRAAEMQAGAIRASAAAQREGALAIAAEQGRLVEVQKQALGEQRRLAKLQNIREIRQQIRGARIAQGAIRQRGEKAVPGGSTSVVAGATAGVRSQLGANISFLEQSEQITDKIISAREQEAVFRHNIATIGLTTETRLAGIQASLAGQKAVLAGQQAGFQGQIALLRGTSESIALAGQGRLARFRADAAKGDFLSSIGGTIFNLGGGFSTIFGGMKGPGLLGPSNAGQEGVPGF